MNDQHQSDDSAPYGPADLAEDIFEIIGPDTPVFDCKDDPKRRKSRGRPNRVFDNMHDMVHLFGPDTPILGGPSLAEQNRNRDKEPTLEEDPAPTNVSQDDETPNDKLPDGTATTLVAAILIAMVVGTLAALLLIMR